MFETPAKKAATRRREALAAAAVALWGVWDTAVASHNGLVLTDWPPVLAAAVSMAVGISMYWHWRKPLFFTGLAGVGHLLAYTPGALALAMYHVGTQRRKPSELLCFSAVGCAVAAAGLPGGMHQPGPREFCLAWALVLGPMLTGHAASLRRDLVAAAEEQVHHLEQEQEFLAERSKAKERSRIARDVHDIIAHRVSDIVVTASALQTRQEEFAPSVRQAIERIRGDGHTTLEELRESLGLLNSQPNSAVTRLSQMVEHSRQGGRNVSIDIDGHLEILPDAMQMAVYRIVQEAITNAAKHAPAADVAITLACDEKGLEVRVTNTASSEPVLQLPGSGQGLTGLRERVRLLGGWLSAGPLGETFEVCAFVPHGGPVSQGVTSPAMSGTACTCNP